MLPALEAAGLLPRFDAVVTGDDVYRGTPDPEGYLYAAQKIARPPLRCVVIGASNLSIEAAHEVRSHWRWLLHPALLLLHPALLRLRPALLPLQSALLLLHPALLHLRPALLLLQSALLLLHPALQRHGPAAGCKVPQQASRALCCSAPRAHPQHHPLSAGGHEVRGAGGAPARVRAVGRRPGGPRPGA